MKPLVRSFIVSTPASSSLWFVRILIRNIHTSNRVQCISCSKACRCSENCKNRPFRKDKKIKLVKVKLLLWKCITILLNFYHFSNFLSFIAPGSKLFSYNFISRQTEHCGWGVEAAEPINKDDFVIEYIGEGIFVSFPGILFQNRMLKHSLYLSTFSLVLSLAKLSEEKSFLQSCGLRFHAFC